MLGLDGLGTRVTQYKTHQLDGMGGVRLHSSQFAGGMVKSQGDDEPEKQNFVIMIKFLSGAKNQALIIIPLKIVMQVCLMILLLY